MPRRRKKIDGISSKQINKVMRGKKVTAAALSKAGDVRDYWKGVSPIFGDKPPHRQEPAHGEPADYQSSITVEDLSDQDGARFRVAPKDFKKKWIEFGTAHMPKYAPMAKTKARFRK